MSIVKEWREVVSATATKGSWFCSGGVTSPSVEINSQCTSYPFKDVTIAAMKTVAQPAPFGKGNQTVVDETVRKGLQIEPGLVKFCNPESWNRRLQAITQELRNAFQRTNITLQFYKMLLYEQGGHFASHKDTLRDKTHIASLLISLPVEGGCEGGVLRVSGPGVSKEVMEWDGRCDDLEASWCSFYTDCQHELTPLTAGRRVVLAYQVYSDDSITDDGSAVAAEVELKNVKMFDVIDCALTQKDNALILLQHKYSADCEPKHLKGFDRVLYELVYHHYKHTQQVVVVGLSLNFSRSSYHGGNNKIEDIDMYPTTAIPNKLEGENEYQGDPTSFGRFLVSYGKNGGKSAPRKDPIHFATPVGQKRASADDVEPAGDNQKKTKTESDSKTEEEEREEQEDDEEEEYSDDDERDERIPTYFLSSPNFAMLFNTDDFEKRDMSSHTLANDYTGNEASPEEMTYKFYALAVCKK